MLERVPVEFIRIAREMEAVFLKYEVGDKEAISFMMCSITAKLSEFPDWEDSLKGIRLSLKITAKRLRSVRKNEEPL